MVYVIENNGVYGLTKGQFSATADEGQQLKYARLTTSCPRWTCALEAIVAGATSWPAPSPATPSRSQTLLKAALAYHGTAVLDIISPCVTFNNHADSTKSYSYGKAHEEPLHDLSFIPSFAEVQVEYAPGEVRDVRLHDGPLIRLRKLGEDYNPGDRAWPPWACWSAPAPAMSSSLG